MKTLEVMTALHFREHTGAVDPPEDTSHPTQSEKRAEPEWSLDHILFSENRVKRALKKFSPLTAEGPGGIRPIMLQKGRGSIKQAYVNLAKACYQKRSGM